MIFIRNCFECDLRNLRFVGKGAHGKVYLIDSGRCIKIFKTKEARTAEAAALMMAQGNRHFPKMFEYGDKCIIREYIEGIPLDKYLEVKPLTLELSKKLIDLYYAMKEVGFCRMDTVLFHIFVTKDGKLKMIDTAKSFKIITAYPGRLLKGLEKLGYKKTFLGHVNAERPELYKSWMLMKK